MEIRGRDTWAHWLADFTIVFFSFFSFFLLSYICASCGSFIFLVLIARMRCYILLFAMGWSLSLIKIRGRGVYYRFFLHFLFFLFSNYHRYHRFYSFSLFLYPLFYPWVLNSKPSHFSQFSPTYPPSPSILYIVIKCTIFTCITVLLFEQKCTFLCD